MIPGLLHQTDLFRPYNDPDDHWDLACVYALAAADQLDLGGILIDFPPDHYLDRSPDVTGVAQLSYLTGIPTKVAVGSSIPYNPDSVATLSTRERAGAEFILRFLRHSNAPAFISIVGSCRDVAIAAKLEPLLFREKCAGIYLNAGTGHPDAASQGRPEYNVLLNASAYAAIFDIACPIFWMPCFESLDDHGFERKVQRFGTHYRFKQGDVLPKLSRALQSYFTYCLEGRIDARYLQPLLVPERDVLSPDTLTSYRSMWCTAGFFHMTSHSVDKEGSIVPLTTVAEDAVFRFRPADITCDASGVTSWTDARGGSSRFIFEVLDFDAYPRAMATAMTTLLTNIK